MHRLGTALAQEHHAQRRHHDEQHDRSDQKSADHDRRKWPLHLAPDGRGDRRREQADIAVISIGRIRCVAAWNIASVAFMPVA
jgi:hypothetical protein